MTQPAPVESTVSAAFIPGGRVPADTVHDARGAVPLATVGEIGKLVFDCASTVVTATFEYARPAMPSGIATLVKLRSPPPPAGGKLELRPPPTPWLQPAMSSALQAAASATRTPLPLKNAIRRPVWPDLYDEAVRAGVDIPLLSNVAGHCHTNRFFKNARVSANGTMCVGRVSTEFWLVINSTCCMCQIRIIS